MADQLYCAWCHELRDPADLVEVERVATGLRRFVCRPSSVSYCFRDAVGRADVDRVIPERERSIR